MFPRLEEGIERGCANPLRRAGGLDDNDPAVDFPEVDRRAGDKAISLADVEGDGYLALGCNASCHQTFPRYYFSAPQ